jgi:hypothetical protein
MLLRVSLSGIEGYLMPFILLILLIWNMKYKTSPLLFLLFSGLTLMTFSCHENKQAPAEKPAVASQVPAEKLIGIVFNYDKSEIELTVTSSGCTGKANFRWSITGNSILVERIKKDECKAMPEAIKLIYSFKEAGLDTNKAYTISNSFIANPGLAAIR